MKLARTMASVAMALCLCDAQAELTPTPGRLDARIRTALYDPQQVYQLHGTLGYAIDLIVGVDEELIGLSGGDLEAVVVAANKNRLTVKPTLAPLSTNFTLLTNVRAYHIEYHVSDKAGVEPQIFSVQFIYAPIATAGPTPAQKVDQALKRAQPILNTDYWYCGDLALEPESASDDGLHTRLTFSADTEWPAIYVLSADGAESLVNFSVQGHTAVIHRLFERLILRRGKLVGCVFNRAFIHVNRAPGRGTVSPQVRREIKGARR